MSQQNDWQKFTTNLLRYSEPDLWLDLSLMDLPNDLIETKEKCINKSLDEIRKIEEGAKVNTDEDKDKIPEIAKTQLNKFKGSGLSFEGFNFGSPGLKVPQLKPGKKIEPIPPAKKDGKKIQL